MNSEKLDKWADLLLDTGKRNNLINFKDTKTGTVDIVSPDSSALFARAMQSATFEVYDPKLDDDEDDEGKVAYQKLSRDEYIKTYEGKLKKSGQILVYNSSVNPITALKNIVKKARTAIEETGVNIAYMAFGFINWTENNSQIVMRVPVLLAPITIINDSAIDPYRIKVMDDDLIVNPTFSFKMQNDYGFKLPDYEDEGIEEYLYKVAQLVSKLKWLVSSECKIGLFSFQKINMYKDLKDNAPTILKNTSVLTLMGESIADLIKERAAGGKASDAQAEFHNVVDADSSQTEAIEMARSGQSFVLQGPPGTGKSQTITNIIAECLSDGKKVLFVSEKLAALNVVYDKLKKAGLEEFCLELHSHKANKKVVIAELCKTLKAPKSAVSERAKAELQAKKSVQKELDQYAEELHRERPVINKSLYSLYERVSAFRSAPAVHFVIPDIENRGEEYIAEANSALKRFVEFMPSVGYDYHLNVWYGYKNPDCSYQGRLQAQADFEEVLALCAQLEGIEKITQKSFGLAINSISQAHTLRDFFALVKSSNFITPALLNLSTLESVTDAAKKLAALAREILADKKTLDEACDRDVYKLDGQNLYKKLTKQFNGFFSRLFSGEYKHIVNEIRLCKNDGKKPRYKAAVALIATLQNYQQKSEEFASSEEGVAKYFGSAYNGVTTDFVKLTNELDALGKILSAAGDLGDLPKLSASDFNEEKEQFARLYTQLNECLNSYEKGERNLTASFDANEFDVLCSPKATLIAKFSGCLNNLDKLVNWCEFEKLIGKLNDLKLREFADKAIEMKLQPQQIVAAYMRAFYLQWVDIIVNSSPILFKLTRIPHDEAVKLFKEKDELNFEISKAQIKAGLSAARPGLDMVAQGSAIAILLREGEKKRKQKGIRTLLGEIGDLALTLKPCFLMSPLSVSTFLSPDMQFDVVVFDEASQIFPQDAIGAIYRGKQLIVVGDSKQMPPSNFFNAVAETDDDEEEEDVTDFESILDLCSTAFPQRRLKWHYRSRCEELISFSNKNFYENDLITFPSSKEKSVGRGVDYIYVDGVFDRKSKTNRVEAERIVDLVFENIEKYPDRSLGVVAFSISQQNLIDKLISKRRKADQSAEEFFRSDKAEPFFVKNLETVQGDERDTIIFSIAYAKDAQGRLLLNFGPVNKEGGERRLNVAVTRAKYNVQVVASIHYTDIDLTRTKSVGARLLREYLDYAENGNIALERAISLNQFEQFESEFEMEVCEFLREKGYRVDTQVGCSSFRIDLAIRHPDSSDYVLAIECDGATYHSSKNARDRDRLRQEILERMGWKFYRIWSTDWFRNKSVEKERLLRAVKDAIENPTVKQTGDETCEAQSFDEAAVEKHFKFPEYVKADELKLAKQYRNNVMSVVLAILELEAPVSEEWLLKRIVFMFGREKVTNVVRDEYKRRMYNCERYGITRRSGFLYLRAKEVPMLRVPNPKGKAEREIKYIALEELANGMMAILKQNLSVEKSGMFKLIAQQLGFSRMGDAIEERFESALKLISADIEINGDTLSLK
jgi:very-short-patch-repair endonuclease